MRGVDVMKIKYVHVVRNDRYRKFVVLYDDKTWEELFQVDSRDETVDGKLFLRKTRDEAMEIFFKQYGIKKA